MGLLRGYSKKSGRNSQGIITLRGRGGGNKRRYRFIDFKVLFLEIPAKVIQIERDPCRTAFIALILYSNGFFSYMLAPVGLLEGMFLLSGPNVPYNLGNSMPIGKVPIGYSIFNIELSFKGGQFCRAAGTTAKVFKQNIKGFTIIKLRSGCFYPIVSTNYCTLGRVSNLLCHLKKLKKAGDRRNLGYCPIVRGVAKNPIDHPHGGGEGKTSGGRPSVSPWAVLTKGFRTGNIKRAQRLKKLLLK